MVSARLSPGNDRERSSGFIVKQRLRACSIADTMRPRSPYKRDILATAYMINLWLRNNIPRRKAPLNPI